MKKYLKEFRLDDISAYNVGDTVFADIFAEGDKVDVTGISKGKGYAGVIKRWNATFPRARPTASALCTAHVGSMGANTDPVPSLPRQENGRPLWALSRSRSRTWTVAKVDAEN